MDAISAEDADLVARLLAMDKLELEQSQVRPAKYPRVSSLNIFRRTHAHVIANTHACEYEIRFFLLVIFLKKYI